MNASVRGRVRWSNIGFALFTVGLVHLLAGANAPMLSGSAWSGGLALGVLAGALLAFLYPLQHEHAERRRALVGVIIGAAFLVLAWVRILKHL
jgi:uncharacterized membrane protein YccC